MKQLFHHQRACYEWAVSIDSAAPRWLLLIHQLPPRPSYLRVRIWRRLQALGAVAIKSTVYVLPLSEQGREDFSWLVQEIVREGGDASVCEARFVEGLGDEDVEALFAAARDVDYQRIAEDARALSATLPRRAVAAQDLPRLEGELARLRRRLAEVAAIDFFAASGREGVEGLLTSLASRLHPERAADVRSATVDARTLGGRTWVTRKGVHVDRIACAWLVRRFVDPAARFTFVAARGYRPEPDVIRFDMSEAEFTHEGDRCTFEVMCERLALDDRALRAIAEIVHDIDLKDGKFARLEAAGVDRVLLGLAMTERDDEQRLLRGGQIFDDLYEYFRRKGGRPDEERNR